jgi:hypothetical protein
MIQVEMSYLVAFKHSASGDNETGLEFNPKNYHDEKAAIITTLARGELT